MYFFGKLAWVAALFVFIATWQALGEVFALILAVGAWLIVWQVSKSIVNADQERTARKKIEKQIDNSLVEYYGAEVARSSQPESKQLTESKASERLIDTSDVPSYRPGADKQANLPYWSYQLTPNRREWLGEKIADGLEQGEDRLELEQRLKLQVVELGWIE